MQRIIRTAIAGAATTAFAVFLWFGPSSVQAAAIGGPFQLVDHTGRRSPKKASTTAICWSISATPTALTSARRNCSSWAKPWTSSGELGDEVQPLFVTVDPARDTVARLPSMCPRSILAWLASPEAMSRSTTQPRAYRVYFRLNEPDENGAYLVDHTSYIYFMDPDGDYLTHCRLRPGA